MSISKTLASHLAAHEIQYSLLRHPHTASSMDTAAVAHVPGDRLAKGVLVKDEDAFVMVMVPSDYHVHLGRLHQYLGHEVGLATEDEVTQLFPDCETGAVPPIGTAFGHRTLIDKSLLGCPEVFFESGDHETLVRVDGAQFGMLLDGVEAVDVGMHI